MKMDRLFLILSLMVGFTYLSPIPDVFNVGNSSSPLTQHHHSPHHDVQRNPHVHSGDEDCSSVDVENVSDEEYQKLLTRYLANDDTLTDEQELTVKCVHMFKCSSVSDEEYQESCKSIRGERTVRFTPGFNNWLMAKKSQFLADLGLIKTETKTVTISSPCDDDWDNFYDGVGISLVVLDCNDDSNLLTALVSVSIPVTYGTLYIAENVGVADDGTFFTEVPTNGIYNVQVTAEGYIDVEFEVEVQCSSDNCVVIRYICLSPVLPPLVNRIILQWDYTPRDLHLSILGVHTASQITCFSNKNWDGDCPAVTMDRTSVDNSLMGPGSITFLDPTINSNYVYVIAFIPYNYVTTTDVTMRITNNDKTIWGDIIDESGYRSLSQPRYFYGCVFISADGVFMFIPAPGGGLWFNTGFATAYKANYDNYCV